MNRSCCFLDFSGIALRPQLFVDPRRVDILPRNCLWVRAARRRNSQLRGERDQRTNRFFLNRQPWTGATIDDRAAGSQFSRRKLPESISFDITTKERNVALTKMVAAAGSNQLSKPSLLVGPQMSRRFQPVRLAVNPGYLERRCRFSATLFQVSLLKKNGRLAKKTLGAVIRLPSADLVSPPRVSLISPISRRGDATPVFTSGCGEQGCLTGR